MIDTHNFGAICNHLAKTLQTAVTAILQMMRVHAETEHATGFTEPFQDCVRLVAQCRVPKGRVRMGNDDRSATDFNRIEGRTFGRVAHVDDEPDAIHFFNHLATHARDAGILRFVAARGQQRLVVISQLHETGT